MIVTYQDNGVRWLGPLNADESLMELMNSVSDEELSRHALAYRPMNQPDEEPLRYHGVVRSTTLKYDGRSVPIQVLVVTWSPARGKSDTKTTLDRDRRETYLNRLRSRLDEIQRMLNTRRYKRRDYTWNQIEQARQGNPAKRFVAIELNGTDGDLTLTYYLDQEALAAADALDGRYLLGTNDHALTALQMLARYKGQDIVERRTKTVKGPIRIRPLFLQREERIHGLIFVTMIAILIYTILEMLCRRAGEYITARQVLEKFEHLEAMYLQFSDGSQVKLPSALTVVQGQLIGLLKFPPPETYLQPLVVPE